MWNENPAFDPIKWYFHRDAPLTTDTGTNQARWEYVPYPTERSEHSTPVLMENVRVRSGVDGAKVTWQFVRER